MIGWLIVLAFIVIIAFLPVGIALRYDNMGAKVSLLAGPLRILLYPGKSNRQKKKKKDDFSGTARKTGKSGGSVFDFLPLLQLLIDFLREFRRKIVVKNLQLKLMLGGGDPCDLAINYGRAWATLGNLVPLLESVFVIKKRNLEVECDFCAEKTTIFANLDLTITIGRLLSMLVCYGVRAIKEYLKIMNKRKGGAVV